MYFDRYSGMAAVVGILLIWAIIAWLGLAGPIWHAYWTASPEQWLGVAGAIAGALATIAAGAAALFAAFKALGPERAAAPAAMVAKAPAIDRKSTRLNSSHVASSY